MYLPAGSSCPACGETIPATLDLIVNRNARRRKASEILSDSVACSLFVCSSCGHGGLVVLQDNTVHWFPSKQLAKYVIFSYGIEVRNVRKS